MNYLIDNPEFLIILGIGVLALYIAMTVAILQIPKIAKNTKATMKLTALVAKKNGVDENEIEQIINEVDSSVFKNMQAQLKEAEK